MAEANVAELVVLALEQAGVERIYGIVGDSLNGLAEALRRRGTLAWAHVRHEEVAAFAAAGEVQVTGKLAVCAGSCGPGNLHLINGLFDAQRTRVPVLAIAAHIPSGEIGGGYFQETHPQSLFKECSVYCELVSSPVQMPFVLENAIRAAVAESGVAVVVLPGDVAQMKAPKRPLSRDLLPRRPATVPPEADLDALAELLNGSERVALFCGRGCAGAHRILMRLCANQLSPMVHTLGGKEHLEFENPYDVGLTGFIGFPSGWAAMHDCDTLLMLGTDFPYKHFIPDRCRIAQVDIRGGQLGRRAAIDLGLVGDVRATVEALLPRLKPKTDRAFLEASLAHYGRSRADLDDLARGTPGRRPIHPQYLARLVSEAAADDAIFTADVGTPVIWAARYLRMNGARRLIGSWSHGSMANALAHGIGAQAAQPGRQVVALCGDGGLSMLMGDLLTLRQLDLPIKIVVFNNGSLGFVALEAKAAGLVDYGTDLENPDFAAVARAAGLHGLRVEDPGDLPGALLETLNHAGPALIDVVTAKHELSMPPRIEAEQVKGFSLFMLKAVMSGRGDAVLELARDNLLPR